MNDPKLHFHIVTLFPEMFAGPFSQSILKRAQEQNLIQIKLYNLRDWAIDKHGTVDEPPYGGGVGMVLRPEPIFHAVEEIKRKSPHAQVILLSPRGKPFDQPLARQLAEQKEVILICGHYEGVDERVREQLADAEISIGDYVLTGGELPAMVLVDAIARLVPGVLEEEATTNESFGKGESGKEAFLEHPQYTRPENFRGLKVPEILLSGNHAEITKWRRRQAVDRTAASRPDLLKL